VRWAGRVLAAWLELQVKPKVEYDLWTEKTEYSISFLLKVLYENFLRVEVEEEDAGDGPVEREWVRLRAAPLRV